MTKLSTTRTALDTEYPMSKFTTALAAAKPSDSVKLPSDTYLCKIVSATPKPGNSGLIIRLDLDTVNGATTGEKFAGRKQVKNQPISEAAAPYVAALCYATGNEDVLTNTALAEGLESGEELVLRRFVGKMVRVARSYNAQGDTLMEIAHAE